MTQIFSILLIIVCIYRLFLIMKKNEGKEERTEMNTVEKINANEKRRNIQWKMEELASCGKKETSQGERLLITIVNNIYETAITFI